MRPCKHCLNYKQGHCLLRDKGPMIENKEPIGEIQKSTYMSSRLQIAQMKTDSKIAQILCEFCYPQSYAYASQGSLAEHKRRVHPEMAIHKKRYSTAKTDSKEAPILCEFCSQPSYEYASQASLAEHMRRVHPQERARNKFGDPVVTSSSTTSKIKRRIQERTEIPEGPLLPLQCKYCGPDSHIYANGHSLSGHIRNKHSEDQLWCKFCGAGTFVFPSKDALRRHIQAKHATESRLDCQICGAHFYTIRGYKEHVKEKTCLKPRGKFQRSLLKASAGSFASDGAVPGDATHYSMTEEEFHAFMLSHPLTDTDGPEVNETGENCAREGPMTDEEYQDYTQFFWQQEDPEVFNPNALGQDNHLQDFGTLDHTQLTQAVAAASPATIDQGEMPVADSSNTTEVVWNAMDQSLSAQVAIASAQAAQDFGFDFDALEQQMNSGDTQMTESSMTTEEYQNYLRSIGLY